MIKIKLDKKCSSEEIYVKTKDWQGLFCQS